MPTKISYVLIYVADLERSVKFYREVLGFKVRLQEKIYVEFETEGTILALSDVKLGEKVVGPELIGSIDGSKRNFSLTLGEVENIDATFEELSKKGVEFVNPPTTHPWGQRTAYFKDPEGNILELFTWVKKEKE